MYNFLISLGLGLTAAIIDTAPMIIRKMDRTFILSAFFTWLVLGIIIPSAKLIPISWLNGAVITMMTVIPIIVLVTKLDRQAIPVMLASALVLGALIGFVSGLLIK